MGPESAGRSHESGGRINHGGGSDGEADVAIQGLRCGRENLGIDRLAEPNDRRWKKAAAAGAPRRQLVEVDVEASLRHLVSQQESSSPPGSRSPPTLPLRHSGDATRILQALAGRSPRRAHRTR